MGNSAFTVSNLSFAYGKNKVISDLSFKIPDGKITTLMGANGCGKTTLFNLMTKNLKPNSGTIKLGDRNVSGIGLRDFSRKVAIVHQNNTAPDDITVEQLVSYGRTPYKHCGIPEDREADEEKIRRAMDITGVYGQKDKTVSALSGGQRQRVWIAMALAQDTKILFLDEPTTFLDIRYQVQILELVKRLNSEYGITIVMVLHDINQALYYSDEVLALGAGGTIIAQGAPREVITEETIYGLYGINLEVINVNGKRFVLTV